VHRPTTNHLHTLAKHSNIFSVLFCLKWLIYLDPVKKNQKTPEQISFGSKSQPFLKIPAGMLVLFMSKHFWSNFFFFSMIGLLEIKFYNLL
jgi:hypothetical protein